MGLNTINHNINLELKIVQWNANSINNKIEEFKMFMLEQNIDICIVTETKLGNNTSYGDKP